jgi:hypothetical protein
VNEIIFLVEESPEGGFTARALGESIFTEAESIDELHEMVRDAYGAISMMEKRRRWSGYTLFARK